MEKTSLPAEEREPVDANAGPERSLVPGHWVFVGPDGLRAGWSLLVFAAICAILIFLGGFLFRPFVHFGRDGGISPTTGILLELSQLVPVVVATWIMAMLEGRPVLSYGYQGRARVLRFISGMVWGFVAISAVVLVLRQLGYLSLDGRTLGGAAALKYAVLWGAVFLCVGFCEESMFRGYAQYTITRGIGFWWGALLFAVLFGSLHRSNPGESPIGLFSAGGIGLVFCLSLWYTGSLWWAVGFHAAWDWGQSYFFGTADSGMIAQGHLYGEHPVGKILWSGGTTGPEGSVIVIPLLVLIALLMVLWWGKRGEKPFRGMGWRPQRIAPSARVAEPIPSA